MNLQDLGRWGTTLFEEATNQLAGADILSGASKPSQPRRTGGKHTFNSSRTGGVLTVSEVCHLADGAFGAVAKVRDGQGKNYALKRIECTEGVQIASTLAEAEREAALLKSLPAHDNIIKCFASSTDQRANGTSTVKLLLELCPGGTLLEYMDKKDGKLSAKEVVKPFDQIVAAVGHLHSQNPPIQHRDLKVENVLMGNDGMWKLCDFGSCSTEVIPPQELSRQRLLDLQEHIDKTVTMLYRPPEMADIELNFRNGYDINTQVDIWMLGCILYTLSFYRHPFQDCPTALAISSGKYFIPQDHPSGKSQKLCGLVHWLLAKDPKDRPVACDITQLLRDMSSCDYQDMFQKMPTAVQEKIKKIDLLFGKRRDTGDIPLPPAAAAVAGSKLASSSGRASRQTSSAAPTSAVHDAFDITGALSPVAPISKKQPVSAASKVAAPIATAEPVDLLSFEASQPRPSASTGTASLSDLLGDDLLGIGAPTAAPSNSFDFFATNTAARSPSMQTSSGSSTMGYKPSSQPLVAPVNAGLSNSLLGLDFSSASSVAPSSVLPKQTLHAVSPFQQSAAKSCSGEARAANLQPADVGAVNLLDLCNF